MTLVAMTTSGPGIIGVVMEELEEVGIRAGAHFQPKQLTASILLWRAVRAVLDASGQDGAGA